MNEEYMAEALKEAKKAFELGEIPVGAVVVRNGEIIGRGHNTRETGKQTAGHAEMAAIEQACRTLNDWRLEGCAIYVTLEPCPMCAGAIMQARISDVYFAADDPKAGAFGGVFDLSVIQGMNYYPLIHQGLMACEAKNIMDLFFAKMRDKRNKRTGEI
jgi:tRNA(adenine34) deaminase